VESSLPRGIVVKLSLNVGNNMKVKDDEIVNGIGDSSMDQFLETLN
jgi:hypothetical protein